MKSRWRLIFIAGFFLFSCGAHPSLYLNKDGSGRFEFLLRLEKPFVDYLLDLGEAGGVFPSRKKAIIFDLGAIEKRLKQYEGVKITSLKATPAGELSLSFTFNNIAVFTRPSDLWPKGSLLSFTAGETPSLRLKLNKEAVNNILTVFVNFKAGEFESFLPRAGETRKEYYANLDFALEDGAKLFKQSSITFLIKVDGKILDHNGVLKNPSTAEFYVPLDKVLFLEKALEYYITYDSN